VDITIELTDGTEGCYEASCPHLGLVARASSLDEVLGRISGLVLYVMTSLDDMPQSIGERLDGVERLSATFEDKNFCLPRHPKVH